jgi:hypothetical protein
LESGSPWGILFSMRYPLRDLPHYYGLHWAVGHAVYLLIFFFAILIWQFPSLVINTHTHTGLLCGTQHKYGYILIGMWQLGDEYSW